MKPRTSGRQRAFKLREARRVKGLSSPEKNTFFTNRKNLETKHKESRRNTATFFSQPKPDCSKRKNKSLAKKEFDSKKWMEARSKIRRQQRRNRFREISLKVMKGISLKKNYTQRNENNFWMNTFLKNSYEKKIRELEHRLTALNIEIKNIKKD